MNRVLIARMNTNPDLVYEFNSWYDGAHMQQVSQIPGFGAEHRRYQALPFAGRHWTYEANPEFTAVYQLKSEVDLEAAINSDEYRAWSSDFLSQWGKRTSGEVSLLCDQILGQETPLTYEVVLIAQMNVGGEHEDEFNDWYNTEHIPQAGQIPGFGRDHRRFRSLELRGRHWHYRSNPLYTSMYEIDPRANVLDAINSDEYRAWSRDFLDRWRNRTTDEVSTICKRIF